MVTKSMPADTVREGLSICDLKTYLLSLNGATERGETLKEKSTLVFLKATVKVTCTM